MTTNKLRTLAFTSAPAAFALLGIASATVEAQDDLSHPGASYWKSQETSTPLPAGFLPLAGGVPAPFVNAVDVPPNRAYFEVNIHYCTLPATGRDLVRWVPTGAAAVVYEVVLVGAYGGNCDDFYASEVRPRLHLNEEGS